VPERASLELDARFETARDAAELERRLEEIVADPFAGIAGVPDRLRSARMMLEGGITRPPMEPTERTRALLARYERVAAECGLGIGECERQGGGSDANLLAAAGVPCIDGLGPWGEHFHETTEWSSLASLCRRTEALALFLFDVARAAG
jgi:glutamate carboxypeptidase